MAPLGYEQWQTPSAPGAEMFPGHSGSNMPNLRKLRFHLECKYSYMNEHESMNLVCVFVCWKPPILLPKKIVKQYT